MVEAEPAAVEVPEISDEELKRETDLFAPLIADKETWEATFTEEEKASQELFEKTLCVTDEEGG